MHILVVEDDPVTRRAVTKLLQGAGYQVTCVGDGRAALDHLLAHQRPGLILLDLGLPGMSGEEFREQQRLTPEWAAIPVILLSAENHLDEQAMNLGVAGFLRKPVSPEELLQTVWEYAAPATAAD